MKQKILLISVFVLIRATVSLGQGAPTIAKGGYINDGTDATKKAAVMNSTPAGTEQGLVVRPASPMSAGAATISGPTTMQNAATANGNGTNLNVSGYDVAVLNITASVAMSGGTTINFEISVDNTTWVPIKGSAVGTSNFATTATATGDWRFYVSGYSYMRARISAYSAGTITVKGYTMSGASGPSTHDVNVVNTPSVSQSGAPWAQNITQFGSNNVVTAAAGIPEVAITDSTGNAITSNSTTTTSKRYLDINVLTFAGTLASLGDLNNASSIAGVLDVGPVLRYDSTPPTLTSGRWNFFEGDSRGSLNISKGPNGFSIDNTTFAATESGNWNVRLQDTSGNGLTSNSTTYSSKFGLDINILGTLGTAFSTPGKIDVILNAETTKVIGTVRFLGNGGATLDAPIGGGTAPTNAIAEGGVFNDATLPAPTDGQFIGAQMDQAGNRRNFPGVAQKTLSAWNSSSSLNATQNIFTNSGANSVLVQLTQTTTLTAGAVTFEYTADGANWSTVPAEYVLDPTANPPAQISIPYTVQASTNKLFLIMSNGMRGLRLKLSTQITGTGTVTPNYVLLPFNPIQQVVAYSPTAANFNATIGNTVSTQGDVASGSSDSGNPVKQGYLGKTALPTAVSDGQRVNAISDKFGRQIILPQAPRDLVGVASVETTNTTSTNLIDGQGAGVFADITELIITTATGTANVVSLSDGTTTYKFNVPGTIGSGGVIAFSPPLPATSSNTAWTVTSSQTVTTDFIATFVKNK